jgi:hypothetical protein
MTAYIDIGNSIAHWRRELSNSDLHNIGEFTTENILSWLKTLRYTDPINDTSKVQDFHAVCGDIDIRWTAIKPVYIFPSR